MLSCQFYACEINGYLAFRNNCITQQLAMQLVWSKNKACEK